MARAYTTTGIAITFNTGAESGNLRVLDEEGNIVLRTDLGIVEMPSLNLGTPGGGGRFISYESGIKTMDVNVDDGLVMGTTVPITLVGVSAPTQPAGTNRATLYVDVSGGKHRLMVQFDTGAAVGLGTEP